METLMFSGVVLWFQADMRSSQQQLTGARFQLSFVKKKWATNQLGSATPRLAAKVLRCYQILLDTERNSSDSVASHWLPWISDVSSYDNWSFKKSKASNDHVISLQSHLWPRWQKLLRGHLYICLTAYLTSQADVAIGRFLQYHYLGRSHNSKPSQKQGCSPNIRQITNFPTKSCYHLPTIAWKQPWRMALEHPEKILCGSIGNSNPIKCWGTHDLAHRPKIRGECTNDTRWCVLKIRVFWERCLVPDFSTFEKEMVFVMIFE